MVVHMDALTEPDPTVPVLRYLRAIEERVSLAELGDCLTDDVVIVTLPNRIAPAGATSDKPRALAGSERGRTLLRSERYEVVSTLVAGDRVALEVVWTGTLAVPFASRAPGATLRAQCAMIFQVRDGRVSSQHTYDCFDSF